MKTVIDNKQFGIDMNNIVKYSIGFLEGAQAGKSKFLNSVGLQTIDLLKEYVDTMARVDPQMLHHVYEWDRTGSPSARLFDINYTVSNLGLSVKSSFRQSVSVKNGSTVPFYDKARIIENGIPVVIRPKKAQALRFTNADGESVFVKGPITVENPGGTEAQQGFEKTLDLFFGRYFSQSFLRASGIADYLERPVLYKNNLSAGKRGGKSVGVSTGYRWIANAGVR